MPEALDPKELIARDRDGGIKNGVIQSLLNIHTYSPTIDLPAYL